MRDYSSDSDFVKYLGNEILKVIRSGVDSYNPEKFNELALMEFEYQLYA